MATPSVHVAALCGSLRDGSHTRQALKVALEGAEAAGATTTLIDLANLDLPMCNGTDPEPLPDGLATMLSELQRADGIILGTPEYHGGYSGVLKNALDLSGFTEFEGKMVGLVAVAGGAMGGQNPLQALRAVGRALHAWVVPTEATVPRAWQAFDEGGQPKDEGTKKRLHAVGHEVAAYARLHASDEAQAFLKQWETSAENPGGA